MGCQRQPRPRPGMRLRSGGGGSSGDGVVVHEVVRSRSTVPGAGMLNATVRARLLPPRRGLGSTARPPSLGHGAAPWTGDTETR